MPPTTTRIVRRMRIFIRAFFWKRNKHTGNYMSLVVTNSAWYFFLETGLTHNKKHTHMHTHTHTHTHTIIQWRFTCLKIKRQDITLLLALVPTPRTHRRLPLAREQTFGTLGKKNRLKGIMGSWLLAVIYHITFALPKFLIDRLQNCAAR